MSILSFLWYNVAMLLKSIVEKINTTLGRLSPARRIFLSFALVIFLGSLLLSLPLVQAPTSHAGYFDHLFTAVSMVCVTGLFTFYLQCLGAVDLYGLDSDWWFGAHDLYRGLLYSKQAKAKSSRS